MADLRKLKDRAAEHFQKGRFAKAAEALGQVVRADPRDVASRQKLAEALRRSGDSAGAQRAYEKVADWYARDGQLLKAIAIAKVILELSPGHRETQERLAELYARRQGGAPARPVAPAPEAPAADDDANVEIALGPGPARRPEAIELPPEEPGAPLEVERPGERMPAAEQAPAPPQPPPVLVPAPPLPQAPPPPLASAPPAAAEVVFSAASTPFEAILDAAREAEGTEAEVSILVDLPADEPPPTVEAEPSAEVFSALPRIPLFSDLTTDAFVSLAARVVLHRVEAGAVLVAQGDPGSSFYALSSGRVRVERTGPEGKVMPLAELLPGSFFGEMALLSGEPRAASVVAVEPCEVLEIRAEVLLELAREEPQVVESLARFYRRRLLANAMALSPLFRPFNRDERAEIMGRFRTREVQPGTSVITEGEPSDGLYVVLTGALEVWKRREGGPALAARLREGDLFGEMSCLRKGPASATVTAERRSVLLRLPRSQFDELVVTYPQILELVADLGDERQHSLDAVAAGQAEYGDEGLLLT
ncbi:MAG: cyclic nucleotide-binding domain-containing protein [Deltaproteobacteria bacterium]|nr:cyclic nucleotide-binding domain-containing protein [Deltaproteobacteria bacterium]